MAKEQAGTKLRKALNELSQPGHTPKHGAVVVEAYRQGKIPNLIEALYIIAELLN